MTLKITSDFDAVHCNIEDIGGFTLRVDGNVRLSEFVTHYICDCMDIPKNMLFKFRAAAAAHGEKTVTAWAYNAVAKTAAFECASGCVYCIQY